MIDYYLHKKCPLVKPAGRQYENIRCKGCIWIDKNLNKCIFGEHYPNTINLEDFKNRLSNVNEEQQIKLSETWRRFSL